MTFDYSQTYLYKLHKLTNSLDKTFDQILRKHSGISLSQFTLLLSVDQHQPASQRTIASFLDISAAAVSRQVDIAVTNKFITITGTFDRRQQKLALTGAGEKAIAAGMATLEHHIFHIFDQSDDRTNLMSHVDILLTNISSLEQRPYSPLKENSMQTISKATDLFNKFHDINKAVITVQKTVGIHINESWWRANVGPANNDLETAKRFDIAYRKHVEKLRDGS